MVLFAYMATPKYPPGQTTGRPPKFTSVEDMQAAIDKYFDDCDQTKRPYTMAGLAYELDMSRQSLINYKDNTEFLDTIKKARFKIERYVEELMLKSNGVVAGVIFNAKNNFGWVDKQEVQQSGEVKHSYEELSDEQLDSAIKAREDRISKTS